jgi:Cu2+-exporting ATPase
VFIIAMSDMIPNNPLMKIMDASKWNWVQLILSLPVVFLCVLDVFIRAYKSMYLESQYVYSYRWFWVAFSV